MPVDGIGGGSGGAYEAPKEQERVVENQAMEMGTETFLKLLVTQMRYQDPFSGGEDMGDFMSQVAQFTMVERIIKLQQTMEEFVSRQAPTQALNLLNRTVEVKDEAGQVQQGEVTEIRFEEGKSLLKVNGTEYPFEALLRVTGENAGEEE